MIITAHAQSRPLALPRGVLRRAAAAILAADALYRQRRALAALDPARLDDLGLSAADVAREARRPLWSVAATRQP